MFYLDTIIQKLLFIYDSNITKSFLKPKKYRNEYISNRAKIF